MGSLMEKTVAALRSAAREASAFDDYVIFGWYADGQWGCTVSNNITPEKLEALSQKLLRDAQSLRAEKDKE